MLKNYFGQAAGWEGGGGGGWGASVTERQRTRLQTVRV